MALAPGLAAAAFQHHHAEVAPTALYCFPNTFNRWHVVQQDAHRRGPGLSGVGVPSTNVIREPLHRLSVASARPGGITVHDALMHAAVVERKIDVPPGGQSTRSWRRARRPAI